MVDWARTASLVLLLAMACSDGGGVQGSAGGTSSPQAARFEVAFGGIDFERPTDLVQHPSDDDRWYVVEQGGRVHTFLASDPQATTAVAIDLSAFLTLASGGEEGLLGMVFLPDFASSGLILLSYVERSGTLRESVVARYVSGDGGSTFVPVPGNGDVIRFAQQQVNHNGGDIVFGPDGYLYYSMGDGGGGGDPDPEDGQDVTTLFGTVMRLDVMNPPMGQGYAIPPDNPFVASSGRDEIWAYGFRNPWRMSFDRATGELWLGDVGQSSREEIDRVVRGGNYGWDCREGDLDFDPDPNCSPPYIEPEVVHGRDEARSICGGYVYRGSEIPFLEGVYVYGDTGTTSAFAYFFDENPTRIEPIDTSALPSGMTSFAEARDGELYVVTLQQQPAIFKLVASP